MAEKSYRIKANIGQDNVVKAQLSQDIDFLEVLSLKIKQEDTYTLQTSNYGIIVGRVLANEAFGIPNAKVSVFIKLSDEDKNNVEISNLYPYKSILTKDKEGRRYNLLSDNSNDDCYRIVGSFPNKRLVLDNETEIEIYEKYWKYTTSTNKSGDYMIFGVPTGHQTIHVDVDLSDIGILSQKPRDFYYKGYNKEQFDSAEQFKEGKDLENLTQLLSQNVAVNVFPFFGDKNSNEIAITRCDVSVPYKFEPTCVFFGSIISDKQGNYIGHSCGPSRWVGYNGNMVTGEGTIEMIRKTPDGLVEEFPIKGNHLIDGDGVWCYQIPMNLDYIGTDEFGNIIPVQDSKKGIPTRTSVRFRISMTETTTPSSSEHVAKYLVPNIHELYAQSNKPQIINGSQYDLCYEFGSATPKEYFRDLLWNKVYSVKNYIPRFEHRNDFESGVSMTEKNYTGVRSVNLEHSNNVFPFNNARFQLKFGYRLLCLLMTVVIDIIGFYNKLISEIICWELKFSVGSIDINLGKPFKWMSSFIKCIGLRGEQFFAERADTYYFPKCDKECGSIIESDGLKVEKDKDALKDVIQQTLALEYDLVNLDFYNDWVNGTLYLPLWYWYKTAKKKYFFGWFTKSAKNKFCSCDKTYDKLRLSQSCKIEYDSNFQPIRNQYTLGIEFLDKLFDNLHGMHNRYASRSLKRGVIKEFTNRRGAKIYYYAPGVPSDTASNNGDLMNYTQLFATDIILLGSLNNCDLDNLPKTFDSLPSTSVNLPFIATLGDEESGDGVITGLDWGHDGDEQEMPYQDGLLMNLNCWMVNTHLKSCVNLSRLSELHVTLDMDIKMDDASEENIRHDGLITSQEIVENETRAKFASLNHNGLCNLTKNITTNYDTYKFHYIYPVAFDGHLYHYGSGHSYKKQKFKEDVYDSNYTMYRLGEGKDSQLYGRHKKHFYIGDEKQFSFPLYNNSFYFYFGLKEGKTAINKFTELFNGICSKQVKYDFTFDYVAKPGKWCYDINNVNSDFGTIDIEFNGLTETFSYALYNEFNELLIQETNVRSNDLRFGYEIQEGGGGYVLTDDGYRRDGRLKEYNTGNLVTNSLNEPIFLENGVYFLEIINANGRKVTQRINMIQNTLTPLIETVNLGTKFKSQEHQVEDICGNMNYYGEIRIKSFIVDGNEVNIINMMPYFKDSLKYVYEISGETVFSKNGYIEFNDQDVVEEFTDDLQPFVNISGERYYGEKYQEPNEVNCKVICSDGSEIYLILKQENEILEKISNFVCYGIGDVPSVKLEPQGKDIYTLVFNIWKPGDYVLTSNQICNNLMNDNMSVNTISIENGENFQVLINDVPLQILDNDNFKNLTRYSGDTFPRVWLQIENPKNYEFKGTKLENNEYWSNFIDIKEKNVNNENENLTIIDGDSKINILKLQFKTIANVQGMAYVMGEENLPRIIITTKGGKEPILIRNIHPNYVNMDENEYVKSIIVENSNMLEAPLNYPYIIGKNYQNKYWWDENDEHHYLRLNNKIYNPSWVNDLGNYFAVFTNNGGIIQDNSQLKYDKALHIESVPSNANALVDIPYNIPKEMANYPFLAIKSGYFRSLFVDKRISAYGNIWFPIYCSYNIDDENDNWKNGKWDMTMHNVVPMPYDKDYNIIGEKLSYDILMEDNIEYTVRLDKNNNREDCFRFIKYPTDTTNPNADNECVIDTSFGIFNGLFKNVNVKVSANDLDDLTYKLQNYFFDDIIYDLKFDGEYIKSMNGNKEINTLTLKFKKLVSPTVKDFKERDVNLRLVSHLDWYTNDHQEIPERKKYLRNESKLYKCLLSIDGAETDLRDNFNFAIRGSQMENDSKKFLFSSELIKNSKCNVPLTHTGSKLTLEVANCKMRGDLIYDIGKNNNGEEIYNFKSYVDGADTYKVSFDIGPRISVLSLDIFYSVKEKSDYIIWNNERFYLQKNKKWVYHQSTYNTNKNAYEVSKSINNKLVVFTIPLNDYSHEVTDDTGNHTIKGYILATHMCLKEKEYNDLKQLCVEKKYETWEGYYYQNNLIQDYLNKFGIPLYVYRYTNEGTVKYVGGFDLGNIKEITESIADTTSFGSYLYSDNKIKHEYVARKFTINGQPFYVFYAYRDMILSYEPYVSFYEEISNNENSINLPTLIEYKNEKYYERNSGLYDLWISDNVNSQQYFQSNATEVVKFYFVYKEGGENLQSTVNLINKIYDGYKINNGDWSENKLINYVFEFNGINKRWYLRNPNNNQLIKLYYACTLINKEDPTNESLQKYLEENDINETTFIGVDKNGVNISYVMDVTSEMEDYKSIIEKTPQVTTNNKSVYFWVKRDVPYSKINDEEVVIQGKTYKIFKQLFNDFKPQKINDFSCKILKDSYNEDYNQIETNAPFLSCSVSKKYGFEKINKVVTALESNSLSSYKWVSENKAIINEYPRGLIDGTFLMTLAGALNDNKFYSSLKYIPLCDDTKTFILSKKTKNNLKFPIFKDDDETNEVKLWEYILLRYISLGYDTYKISDTEIIELSTYEKNETIKKQIQSSAQTIINEDISWVSIDIGTYYDLLNKYRDKEDVLVPVHSSILDEAVIDCWNIKLQNYGDKYYFQGKMNIENRLKDNIQKKNRYYTNCNYSGFIPYINDEVGKDYEKLDKELAKKFFVKSPIIGEIYPYIDLHSFGSIDSDGLFTLNDEYKKQETFPGVGKKGVQYGQYEPLWFTHQSGVNGINFYGIDGLNPIKSYDFDNFYPERYGIGVYMERFYPQKDNGEIYERIYETSKLYDDMIYVYQPNINNNIEEGTELLTCTICRTYYDANNDYRFKVAPTVNQSTHFNVGTIYVGNGRKENNLLKLPFYIINGGNEEIINGLKEHKLRYYFNSESNVYEGTSLDDKQLVQNFVGHFYPSTEFNGEKTFENYGICENVLALHNKILNGDACQIDMRDKNKWYFINYDSINIKNKNNNYSFQFNNDIQLRLKCKGKTKLRKAFVMKGYVFKTQDGGTTPSGGHSIIKMTYNESKGFSLSAYTYQQAMSSYDEKIFLDASSPMSSFTKFNFSTTNGDTCQVSGETRKVDLLDKETLINNSTYNIFSNVWEVNTNDRYLKPLQDESLRKLVDKYNNGTCEEFFTTLMEETNFLNDEQTNLDDALKKAFNSTFKSGNLVFTVNLQHRLYFYHGKIYESYTKITDIYGHIFKKEYVIIDGKEYEEYKVKEGYYIQIGNDIVYGYYYLVLGEVERVDLVDNNDNFIIEMLDPYDKNIVLKEFPFKGIESNNIFKRFSPIQESLWENKDICEMNLSNQDSYAFNDINKLTEIINNLNEGEYIIIHDKRINGLYPMSYIRKDETDKSYVFLTNMTDINTNNKFEMKYKYLYSLVKYDTNNIFNDIEIRVTDLNLPNNTNEYNTSYNPTSEIVFGRMGMCKFINENIYQIICNDGYTVVKRGNELIETINSSGEKESVLCDSISQQSILSLSLYHLSEVDGIYYEFVSKVKEVKKIDLNDIHVLNLNIQGLKNNEPCVLSLEVNDIIYKLPFTFNNNNLTPGF